MIAEKDLFVKKFKCKYICFFVSNYFTIFSKIKWKFQSFDSSAFISPQPPRRRPPPPLWNLSPSEMAVSTATHLWDSVVELTKGAQDKGSDPLLWAIHLSSTLNSACISLPSTDLAHVLVSHICWANNVPMAWKYLEKALAVKIVPPMLVLALLSSRFVASSLSFLGVGSFFAAVLVNCFWSYWVLLVLFSWIWCGLFFIFYFYRWGWGCLLFFVFLGCLGAVLKDLMFVFSALSVWHGKTGFLGISSGISCYYYYCCCWGRRVIVLCIFGLFSIRLIILHALWIVEGKMRFLGLLNYSSVNFCIAWKVLTLLIYRLF